MSAANGNEACSKALARRTETAYEARVPDEMARHIKVQYLTGWAKALPLLPPAAVLQSSTVASAMPPWE